MNSSTYLNPYYSVIAGLLFLVILSGCDTAESDDPNTFYVSFQHQVEILESPNNLACNNSTQYSLGHPTYYADFEAVEGVSGYTGRVKVKDGSWASEFPLTNIEDLGGNNRRFSMGVGSINIFITCDQASAVQEQDARFNYLSDVGHQGIEITAVFE